MCVCILYIMHIYNNDALEFSQYPLEPHSSVKTFSCSPPLSNTTTPLYIP